MSLNDSIFKDAALAVPKGTLIPAFSQREKEEPADIRRLNPALSEEALATIKRYLKVRFVGGLNP